GGARSGVKAARDTARPRQLAPERRSPPPYRHCYDKLLGEAKLLGRIVTVNGQWNRAVAPDLGWAERYTMPEARLRQYGFKSMAPVRNRRSAQGLRGRASAVPRPA